MSIRHLFAGVNSPDGFYSNFQSIIDEEKAEKIIYIKGGPGTGKSTLMKKIAGTFDGLGEPVEVFHCSSDPGSLDGVHLPNRKIALMDSTAPHVMEPKYPMVNGQIFNAADCLETDMLIGKTKTLSGYCATKKAAFNLGFQYLKAVAPISCAIDQNTYETAKTQEPASKIVERHLSKPSQSGRGTVRPLFLSAVTPDGEVSYLDSLCASHTVASLPANPQHIIEQATELGYDVEAFYCPLFPDSKIDHIHIPEINLWLSSEPQYQPELKHLYDCKQMLIAGAVKAFSDAREAHRAMEQNVFIPAMNFEKLDKMMAHLLKTIALS